MSTLRSLFDRALGCAAKGVSVVSRPNHFDEEPYRLFVDARNAQVLNRFEQEVAMIYLHGEGSPRAIWVLQCRYLSGNISVRLFGDTHREQKTFMRREEAIAFVEDRLGITRDSTPPMRLTPSPGKTMWETEDATR